MTPKSSVLAVPDSDCDSNSASCYGHTTVVARLNELGLVRGLAASFRLFG